MGFPFEDRVKKFLEHRAGLQPKEVPLVLTTFVGVKWSTSLLFILLGVRYRPLNRLFTSSRTRFTSTLKKNRSNPSYSPYIKRYDQRTAEFNRIHVSSHTQTLTFYESLGSKYRLISSKMSEAVASSPMFGSISRKFNLEPAPLALGVAEGLLLYKVTFLIHAPLELYFIVKFFQRRKKEGKTFGQKVGREIGDFVDLGIMVYDDEGEEVGFEVVKEVVKEEDKGEGT
mmetsp:Transcript_5627/g.10198  ORF Transcript_5627/g.10198 Transcript_5627/m.10198 type:complete len:228 (-) Transcript_5627:74-757(-)